MQNLGHGKTIAHFYLWPKLGHYLYLVYNHITNIGARTAIESIQFLERSDLFHMCSIPIQYSVAFSD